jgi:hypothetical protein
VPSPAARRSPKAAPLRRSAPIRTRPPLVPFAVVFGLLVAAEDLYLGWLLWSPDPAVDLFLIVPLVLAALAVTGAVLVHRGRGRGWLVLTIAAVLPMAAMLVLVYVLGAFGAWGGVWAALLFLVGPIGCLALALRRPVREWSSPATRAPGGRRRGGAAH